MFASIRQLPSSVLVQSLLLAVALPSAARAQHLADHLVFTEVAYDTADETAPTSEFVEIFNPSGLAIELNAGAVPGNANGRGSYFFADEPALYHQVVSGPVSGLATSDGVWQFPAGAVIPPFSTVVICSDSAAFLLEFFGASDQPSRFTDQPGHPQLFETTQDGAADGVPDMINHASAPRALSLTNGGEPAILFYWDGQSDLVQDVDIVVWLNAAQVVNKTSRSWDGPDADASATPFHAEAAQITSLGAAAANTVSLQRTTSVETGETASNGNGITGHDETGELWGAGSTWSVAADSPGLPEQALPLLAVDGAIDDALSLLVPVAVSAADGPAGNASPLDYGADGTLTELYLSVYDTDLDGSDELYLALRGSLFGNAPSRDSNASFVLIDLDPGASTGVRHLEIAGNQINDEVGVLDYRLTHAAVALPDAIDSRIGFDAVVGLDQAYPPTDETGGWRSWGSAGTPGALDNLAWLGSVIDARFDSDVPLHFPGAAGTSYAGESGFEAIINVHDLNLAAFPRYLYVIAFTTSDTPGAASPNTLPESVADSYSAVPQPLDDGVCFDVTSGRRVRYYTDGDGDGYGGAPASYCGPAQAGLTTRGGDCADADPLIHPTAVEICDDSLDNNCSGQTDECLATEYCAASHRCEVKLAQGGPCGSNAMCQNDRCVDGYCCSGPCLDQCAACDVTDHLGECWPVSGAPHGARIACLGSDPCAGSCNGVTTSVCHYPAGETSCRAASCANDIGVLAASCDGAGACPPEQLQPCAPYLCTGDLCGGDCSTGLQCAAGHYCAAGVCALQGDLGASCSSPDQCLGGRCVENVCCDSDCTDQCASCQVTDHVGFCWPLAGAPVAGKAPCGGSGVCTGSCDGVTTTHCHMPAAETLCAAASCTGAQQSAAVVCDGTGSCPSPLVTSCGRYQCGTAACLTSCSTSDDCTAGSVCQGIACVAAGTDAGIADAAVADSAAAPDAATPDAATPDTAVGDSAVLADARGQDGTQPAPVEGGGCGCRANGSATGAPAVALLLFGLALRRRRIFG